MTQKIIPVILCGGAGTRLWPISRIEMPKQFLTLLGDQSLLQQTTIRAQSASGAQNNECVYVTLEATKNQLTEQLDVLGEHYTQHILCEPCARNTAPAIALAANYVAKTFGDDAIMWVLPSDHYIKDDTALKDALQDAVKAAKLEYLTTFGIRPDYPETDYGYICISDETITPQVHAVSKFVEKPDALTAQEYLDSGDYLWNSGMFVFKAATVLQEFETHAKITANNVKIAIEHNLKAPEHDAYAAIEKTPFDIAIMEKAEKIAVIPCEMGWTDIGSWHSLWKAMQGLDDKQDQIIAIPTPDGTEHYALDGIEIPANEKRSGENNAETPLYFYALQNGADITVKDVNGNINKADKPPKNMTPIPAGATYIITNTTRSDLKILQIQMQSNINAQAMKLAS